MSEPVKDPPVFPAVFPELAPEDLSLKPEERPAAPPPGHTAGSPQLSGEGPSCQRDGAVEASTLWRPRPPRLTPPKDALRRTAETQALCPVRGTLGEDTPDLQVRLSNGTLALTTTEVTVV